MGRPLVQAKWAERIAARNSDLVDAERLDEFLFGAEPDIPLILRRRDSDPVPAARAHPRAWTGPKSPWVGARACGYRL